MDWSNMRQAWHNVTFKEKGTQADISGNISATLSQIRGVYDNEADIRNFN